MSAPTPLPLPQILLPLSFVARVDSRFISVSTMNAFATRFAAANSGNVLDAIKDLGDYKVNHSSLTGHIVPNSAHSFGKFLAKQSKRFKGDATIKAAFDHLFTDLTEKVNRVEADEQQERPPPKKKVKQQQQTTQQQVPQLQATQQVKTAPLPPRSRESTMLNGFTFSDRAHREFFLPLCRKAGLLPCDFNRSICDSAGDVFVVKEVRKNGPIAQFGVPSGGNVRDVLSKHKIVAEGYKPLLSAANKSKQTKGHKTLNSTKTLQRVLYTIDPRNLQDATGKWRWSDEKKK